MASHRPDLTLMRGKFLDVSQAEAATVDLLQQHPELSGLFAVWDVPGIGAAAAIRAAGKSLPVTTVDLGNEVAAELANNELVKGIAAQQPFDQGIAAGVATILGLLSREPPPWIALPGLPVTVDNVVEAYQMVWHAAAPSELIRSRTLRGPKSL